MKDMTCRWGIIGPGFVATRAVIPALLQTPGACVSAIASRNIERGRTVAQQFAINRVYDNYQELLDDPDIDAVYLALPNHLHREWTIRAALARKQVLCEKPLAISVQECEEMIDACQRANVYLMEAVMYRFHPRMQYLKRMIDEGEIGELRFVHCAFSFPLTDRKNYRNFPHYGGGALLDVGSYCVNAARWLTGAEPQEEQSITRFRDHGEIDITTSALLRFPGNILGHIQCSFDAAEHQVIEVVGTTGAVTAPLAFTAWKDDTTILRIQHGSTIQHKTFAPADPYQAMVAHFTECLLEQRPPDYPPGDGLATLRILQSLLD